ncbi:MAG: hypothetical protein ACTHJ2_04620, partial [Candidatus Nitrosocosmicus sp.]
YTTSSVHLTVSLLRQHTNSFNHSLHILTSFFFNTKNCLEISILCFTQCIVPFYHAFQSNGWIDVVLLSKLTGLRKYHTGFTPVETRCLPYSSYILDR